MEEIKLYQIDAFASCVFSGNPAAVCPLESWPEDDLMQAIAQENNLSETAFFVPERGEYRIRWFTPVAEVDLCGHATLASGFVVFNYINPSRSSVSFESRSGILTVKKQNDLLLMDFPSQPPDPCEAPTGLVESLGKEPQKILCSEDYFVVYKQEDDIRELNPNMEELKKLGLRGVIVTGKGDTVDFVSRFFAPNYGINEDPVTGSAHCALTPYWAKELGKKELHAHQISQRGGELFCVDRGERTEIAGRAVKYMEGVITL